MQHHFNTTNLVNPELGLYEEKAKSLSVLITQIFKERPSEWLTPHHVLSIVKLKTGRDYTITGVRARMTTLSQGEKPILLKSAKATMKGVYNMRNHCWTLNKAA